MSFAVPEARAKKLRSKLETREKSVSKPEARAKSVSKPEARAIKCSAKPEAKPRKVMPGL